MRGFTPRRCLTPPATSPHGSGSAQSSSRVTHDLLDELLAAPLNEGACGRERTPSPIGVGRVESPRGETLCTVELKSGRVARMHLRTGSYANWPALAHATAGNLLPDFPLINKSFELCYACVDR